MHVKAMFSSKKKGVSSILLILLSVNTTFANIAISCNSGSVCTRTWTKPMTRSDNSTVCECPDYTSGYFYHGAKCLSSPAGPRVRLNDGYCMTFDVDHNITVMGKCPYNHISYVDYEKSIMPENVYELNNYMCTSSFRRFNNACGQQRREGLLCGKCQSGLGPAVASYTHQCVECHWYWPFLYFAYVILPATLFCILIILLRINMLSPPMNALVLLCHVLIMTFNLNPCQLFYRASQHNSYIPILIVTAIYGLFNLDFFSYVLPPFCVSSKMSTLQAVSLDYIIALYPLAFTALIYLLIEVHDRGFRPVVVLWSPFHRCLVRFRKVWHMKGSVINAFATFYILSFTKIVSTTVSLSLTANMIDVCDVIQPTTLYYDASCHALDSCHLPYGVVALIISFFFTILPTLFFLFYPSFLLCKCCNKWLFTSRLAPLHEITSIFHQSFKDGTNGTRDCRWFAGVYLVLRVAVVASMISRVSRDTQVIISVVGLFLVSVFQPHVNFAHNVLDSLLFCGLAVIFILIPAKEKKHISIVLIYIVPMVVIAIQLFWKFKPMVVPTFTSVTNFLRIKQCLKTRVCCDKFRGPGDDERQPILHEECAPKLSVVSRSVIDFRMP